MSQYSHDYLISIAVVGDSTVGKSSLLESYMDGMITSSNMSTIGVDMRIKTIPIENKIVKVQIWDTAGQERFRGITTSYYRGASAVMLVYAVNDIFSFHHITSWINTIRERCNPDVQITLIGNKCDLERSRVVTTEMGQELADQFQIRFFETSAKNLSNVAAAFDNVIHAKFRQICTKPKFESNKIILKDSSEHSCFSGRCGQ